MQCRGFIRHLVLAFERVQRKLWFSIAFKVSVPMTSQAYALTFTPCTWHVSFVIPSSLTERPRTAMFVQDFARASSQRLVFSLLIWKYAYIFTVLASNYRICAWNSLLKLEGRPSFFPQVFEPQVCRILCWYISIGRLLILILMIFLFWWWTPQLQET